MAKLLKLRRGTTSQHNTFTGAEGEVTIDTTKDTAVVHDGSTAGGTPLAKEDMSNVSSSSIAGRLGADSIATTKIAGGALPTDVTVASANIVNGTIATDDIGGGQITSAKIADGTIVNADVNASAAIAGTKISPDFGGQTIATTGSLNVGGNVSFGSELNLMGTENNKYLDINLGANVFNIRGTSGGDGSHVTMMTIQRNGATTVRHAGSTKLATTSSGVNVTGNIGVTGTVDGRDVAADGTKLDGIESGATADQTAAEIRTLTESASDSNVFTDADHSKLNGIESGATADQSASEILTAIKTVDGASSGLDADLLDGMHASQNASNSTIVARNSSGYVFANFFNTSPDDRSSGLTKICCETGNDGYIRHATAAGVRDFINVENGATADQTGSEIGTLLNGIDVGTNGTGVANVYNKGWFRSIDSGDGMYNQSTNQHWYSDSNQYWNMGSGQTAGGIRFRQNHGSTINGYVYYNNSNQIGFLNTGGTWSLKCDNSGNVTATGNVTAYSDARLKTNVNTINDALSIVGKLRGVSFDWIESGKRSIGVIAQEVEEVLPELVLTQEVSDEANPEKKEIKSVDYGKIVGVLINAINELKAEVDELKGGK